MAKLTYNDILTKTSNIFNKDVYFVDNRYSLGGIESESNNVSEFLCIYNTDFMDILKQEFPDNNVVAILDIKKVKKEPDVYTKTEIMNEIKDEIIDRRNKLEKLFLSVDKWKSFDFTEEEIDTLFEKKNSIDIFTEDRDIPSVTITSTLFPLIKPNEVKNLYYSIINPKDKEGLIQLVISYDTPWFQVYNLVQYIKM